MPHVERDAAGDFAAELGTHPGFLPEDTSIATWAVKQLAAGFALGAIAATGYAAADAVDRTTGTESVAGLQTSYGFTHGRSTVMVLGHTAYTDESIKLGPLKLGLRVNANTLPSGSDLTKLFTHAPSLDEAKEGYITALKANYTDQLKEELLVISLLGGLGGAAVSLSASASKRWVRYTNGKIEHLEGTVADQTETIARLVSEVEDQPAVQKIVASSPEQPVVPEDSATEVLRPASLNTARSERQHSKLRPWAKRVGAVAVSAAVSLGVGVAKWETSATSESHPAQHISIAAAKDFGLANIYTGTPDDAKFFNYYYRLYTNFINKELDQQEQFVTAATESLMTPENLANIAVPAPNESAIMMGSDIHAKRAMIRVATAAVKLLNSIYDEADHKPLKLVLFAGDNGYRISWDAAAIKQQGNIGQGAPEGTVLGNHDGETPTVDQLHAAKVNIINKVMEMAGIPVVGLGDPQETVYFGDNYLRSGKPETGSNVMHEESAAGQKLYELAKEAGTMPIGLIHEGEAAQAALGFDATSAADTRNKLTDWFNNRNITTAPIGNLPFSLLVYGHWHRIIQPKVVENSDGTKTLVMELNTMGGASGDNNLGKFDTPIGGLGQPASFAIVFRDNKTGLITGYQMFTFEPNGKATINPRVTIDQPLKFTPESGKPEPDKTKPSSQAVRSNQDNKYPASKPVTKTRRNYQSTQ